MAMSNSNPRDLSKTATGSIRVRIHNLDSREVRLESATLAEYVAQAHLLITGNTVAVTDAANAPWEIISYDERKRALLVQPV